MTPNTRAKQLGTTTKEAAEIYGCTPQNLTQKYRNNPRQFDVICLGAAAYKVLKEQGK